MQMFGKGSGYRWMDAYIFSWVVELATDSFCGAFLDFKNDPQGKTSAQMNHAARSGCRNFAEGCERLMTSTASGMDLLNVAKASLGELRDDYLKWLLRARRLPWDDAAPDASAIRRLDLDPPPGRSEAAGTAGTAGVAARVDAGRGRDGARPSSGGVPPPPSPAAPAVSAVPAFPRSTGSARSPGLPRRSLSEPGSSLGCAASGGTPPYSNRRFCEHLLAQHAKFASWLDSPDSFVRADALIILCTRAAKMQEAYIRRLGDEFKSEGGFKERLGEVRREERARAEGGIPPEDAPACPECGSAMRQMHRKRDNSPFWSCGEYPACRGTRPYVPRHSG